MTNVLAHPNSQLDDSEESVNRRAVRFETDLSTNPSIDETQNIGSEPLNPSYIVSVPKRADVGGYAFASNPFDDSSIPVEKRVARGPLVRRFETYDTPRSIDVIHQWECIVNDIYDEGDTVAVDLYDLKDETRPVENGEFSILEIPPSERENIKLGSVLYWAVGYEKRGGTYRRVSEIRLKRMPKLTRRLKMELERSSTELANEFGVDPD